MFHHGNQGSAEEFRRSVLATLGNAPDHIEPGCLQRFSTSARPGDKAGWCILHEDRRHGDYGDWRAGVKQSWSASDTRTMTEIERAAAARQTFLARAARQQKQAEQWVENRRLSEQLWANTQPLSTGDPVIRYLHRRGFAYMHELPACLRYHRRLSYHHDDGRVTHHPAMVAPLVGQDGRIVALHRTYLDLYGRKADVPSPKKLTRGAGQLSGAMIPLFKPDRGRLGIAEGIETALAATAGSSVPTVAAYSAGNLAAWTWPAEVRHLVIFGDNDPAGCKAAETLQERARRHRVRCDVLLPSQPGQDWADVWAAAIADREQAWSAA